MGTRCAVPLAERSHQATRRLRRTSGRECWSAVGGLNLDLFSAGLTSGTTIVSSRSWLACPAMGVPTPRGADTALGDQGLQAFITGSDILMDGGVTATSWHGRLSLRSGVQRREEGRTSSGASL